MSRVKRRLSIFLADLTHTGIRAATDSFPLNIGLIAAYSIKNFGPDIKIKLFKYPDKILHALQNERCDVLACSTYIWNNNLSEWACEMAKKYNPRVITVRGGWNFPLDKEEQKRYMLVHRFTDIYCMYEGERPFANIIKRLLSIEDIKNWNDSEIEGCIFLNPKDRGMLIKGNILPRLDNLDEIPSPYTTGLMDEFFDGVLTPIIETTRGCPFSCNYCNNANDYFKKVAFFSSEYIEKEINYIAQNASKKSIRNLYIADTNFGMYPRDKNIAIILKEMQKRYNWPLGINASTGKNNIKGVINNLETLGNSIAISMSMQSMNPETLKIIKRDNVNLNMYRKISRSMMVKKMSQMAEVIVPLPKETYPSYLRGVESLLNLGAKRVISYTLQLNNGTIYKDEHFRKRFSYAGKYRLIPYDFGTYGGRKIFDYEEVAVFSNSLTFKEYLEIRKLALVMELSFSNYIFMEVFKLLAEKGIKNIIFLKYLLEQLEDASLDIKKVFHSFTDDTIKELMDSEESLLRFYSNEDNYKKLIKGEIGGNVIFKHKGIMLSRYLTEWIEYIFDCANSILNLKHIKKIGRAYKEIENIKVFVTAKLDGLFESWRAEKDTIIDFEYDILSWFKHKQNPPFGNFQSRCRPFRYKFFYDKEQRIERKDLFNRYGDDTAGLAKILAKVAALERMFRKIEELK